MGDSSDMESHLHFETDTESCPVEPISDFGAIALNQKEADEVACFDTRMEIGKPDARLLSQSFDTGTLQALTEEEARTRRLMDDITQNVLEGAAKTLAPNFGEKTFREPVQPRPDHRVRRVMVHVPLYNGR